MSKKVFIGIDFSKETFDASLLEADKPQAISHQQFENSSKGCKKLLKWVGSLTKATREQWLFCGEHTGLCCVEMSRFMTEEKLFLWLDNPLQIKQSTGIKRDKSDKTDSRDIALYAFRFQDRARGYELPVKSLQSLKMLISYRERLMRSKLSLSVSSKELKRVMNKDTTAGFVFNGSQKQVKRIDEEIKEVEARMKAIVKTDEALMENYRLATSIVGIGMFNAVEIMVATNNFTRFDNSRQFACYAGLAPFGKQSGTSVKTSPHVSPLANKKIKSLLTEAAKSAIRFDPTMKAYYSKKLAEGKAKWLALNNVRNKLLHRLFAVVLSKKPYQVDYPANQLEKAA